MAIRHVAILKAKKGEFTALSHTKGDVADRLLPLFEIGRITEDMRQKRKYLIDSDAPTIAYLDRVADGIADAWFGREAMVDAYQWAAGSRTEDGDHIITYMIAKLETLGVPVIPVIGYDRWEEEAYQLGLKAVSAPAGGHYCVRLDTDAIKDANEPDFFAETIASIVDGLSLVPESCSVLIDFGDVSNESLEQLLSGASKVIELLTSLGFQRFITAGCSIPKSIDLAVKKHDTTNVIVRQEMLLWQVLRRSLVGVTILYGDYGVRGPATNDEVRSSNTNGKIRYTINRQSFIVRGHAISKDHTGIQMYGLAAKAFESPHYVGAAFSWGDMRIELCKNKVFMGAPADWIAIDTNHHLAYVSQEVWEFENSVVVAKEKV